MSKGEIVEGGNYKCLDHPKEDGTVFITDSREEWDKHCIDTGHTVSGTAPCLYCKTPTSVEAAPYQPVGVPIPAICPNCAEKHLRPVMNKIDTKATEDSKV